MVLHTMMCRTKENFNIKKYSSDLIWLLDLAHKKSKYFTLRAIYLDERDPGHMVYSELGKIRPRHRKVFWKLPTLIRQTFEAADIRLEVMVLQNTESWLF